MAGIDTNQFKGHSTRAASTSKAAEKGVSISYILKQAHWSQESFQKFYNKPKHPEYGISYQTSLLKSFEKRDLNR